MKANHTLTRLRQDIRKMASSVDEDGYLRYRRFALNKMASLREQYRAGNMTKADIAALTDCVHVFSEVTGAHDGTL